MPTGVVRVQETMKYIVDHRYQNSGWQRLKDFDTLEAAIVHAVMSSSDSIAYGMTRVRDEKDIIIEFWAGFTLLMAEPMKEGAHNVHIVLANKLVDWGYTCIAPYGIAIIMLNSKKCTWPYATTITLIRNKCHIRYEFETEILLELADPDFIYKLVTALDECRSTSQPLHQA